MLADFNSFRLAVNWAIREMTTSWPAEAVPPALPLLGGRLAAEEHLVAAPPRDDDLPANVLLRARGMQKYGRPAAFFAQRRGGDHELRLGRRNLHAHVTNCPTRKPAVGIVDPAHHQRRVLIGIDDAADLIEPPRPGRRVRARADG